ncbi:hypothetical protein M407DRAFT_20886 [Tulasnella calospora MUT 4182]|uniref:F-box domain-containing protein n=1 Tax=Tulasnella calospora MUT 4182 TaxID=1051891 RepID=A0A0C3M8J1_9AGAM|nr:hypothetical protein M407DRAFT_20886 [Tulasnella calospora MUT 4182]
MSSDWLTRYNGSRRNSNARKNNKIPRKEKIIPQNLELHPPSDRILKQTSNSSAVQLHHLDVSQFMGLPYSVIAEICWWLHPKDLLSLARASLRTRCFFMSRQSKPCWDVARSTIGMPEWFGVATPHVVSFLFDTFCQEQGCSNLSSMRSFMVCRSLCDHCASVKLFSKEDAGIRWRDIPWRLLKKLPWTHQRKQQAFRVIRFDRFYGAADHPGISPLTNSLENGKFCYFDDILRLERLCKALGDVHGDAGNALFAELKSRQLEMHRASFGLWQWNNAQEASKSNNTKRTFNYVAEGIKRRWGYDINRYIEVPLFRNLLETLELLERPYPERTWTMIEVQMKQVIREREMANTRSPQKAVRIANYQ